MIKKRPLQLGAFLLGAGLFCMSECIALAADRVVVGVLGESEPLRADTKQEVSVRKIVPSVGDGSIFEPIENLPATRERPIFSPSRRPPVVARSAAEPPPPPVAKPPSRPLFSLVGAITAGEGSIAIFLDETTKAVVRVKSGEEYGGWTLTGVQSREATLQRDDLTATLVLPGPPAR